MPIDWTRMRRRKIVDEPNDPQSSDSSEFGQDSSEISGFDIKSIQEESYAQGFNEGSKQGADAAAREVRGKVIEEGYVQGYTEAYKIVQQCITAYEGGPKLTESLMTYLRAGSTFDEAREAIAEDRAKESARTAIRSAIMPGDGIEPEPAPRRQSVTQAERQEIYGRMNGTAINPWNIQQKRD